MKGKSILDRSFKQEFNQVKHGFISSRNHRHPNKTPIPINNKIMLSLLTFIAIPHFAFRLFYSPDYFHETIGHLHHNPRITNPKFSGRMGTLNNQVIHREIVEQEVTHYIDSFKAYE